MNQTEWNKCFAWVCGLFPNWKISPMISASWFDFFGGEITVDEFKRGLVSCQRKNPSQFPPGLFEILNEIELSKTAIVPELASGEEWEKVLQLARNPHRKIELMPQTEKAIKLIGGIRKVELAQESDLKWIQKEFLEYWKNYNGESITQNTFGLTVNAKQLPGAK